MFTPSTKADVGDHDENISFDAAVALIGSELAAPASATSASRSTGGPPTWAAERGIIIADTKFELGMIDGKLVLADEVLTPDSSRFWPADRWVPGSTPPSFDKQPRPRLPRRTGLGQDAAAASLCRPRSSTASRQRYVEAYERITGLVVRRLAGRAAPDSSLAPSAVRVVVEPRTDDGRPELGLRLETQATV